MQHLLDFERQRRLATLVAVVLDLSATITDEAIEMFDKMLGSLFRKSERRYAERFQQSAKAINEKVRQFALVGRALIEAKSAPSTHSRLSRRSCRGNCWNRRYRRPRPSPARRSSTTWRF